MTTMNISLPDSLRTFVDQQVADRGFSTSSEYIRDLIRKEQDRERLRALLLEGANSPLVETDMAADFDRLRERIRSSG
jgi:antitoxin ParD1/3/4